MSEGLAQVINGGGVPDGWTLDHSTHGNCVPQEYQERADVVRQIAQII